MRRREFIAGLGAAAWPADRVRRVAYLSPRSTSADLDTIEAFREGMRELGYVEGKDFVLDQRHADGQYERLSDLAHELVQLKADVIVAVASAATRAAQHATTTIPIVMYSGDPVASGLVASLARPGGNTTGLSLLSPDLSTKHVELMTMLVPKLFRVAVLLNPGSSTRTPVLNAVENAGRNTGISIFSINANSAESIEHAFDEMTQKRAEAVIIVPDGFLLGQSRQIAGLANKHRLPSIAGNNEYAQSGGLMSYGTNRHDLVRRAAAYVDKIFKGANPADLPVEQPTKFELFLNLKTAKTLGLTVPDRLIALSDELIE